MSGANTITDLKSAFIRRQTRILSQPLQAPQQWKDDCDIPDTAVRSAMREAHSTIYDLHLNRRLARHNRTAYPSIAIRHTAETIDELYWQRSAPKPSTSSSHSSTSTTHLDPTTSTAVDDDPFHPTADLTSAPTIAALPPTWAELVDSDTASSLLPQTTTTSTNDNPLTHQQQQQQSYTAHATNLHALSARRAALRLKISRYKALRAALAPLANPAEKVQPNLVTRDGEVAGEVARARALGVRVAARVGARREERGRERDGGERGRGRRVVGEEDGDAVVMCETPDAARQRERKQNHSFSLINIPTSLPTDPSNQPTIPSIHPNP
ncbi:kinetochore complex Fta4 of Sim4 subunit, or CENP-50-domain-containing protein [Phyllosticta paracitricarpa]|uniref:Kinetochore complex Fta4 of Sim4 subunit, or CENP-50-domain-containing protein n=1 Tax=Phyllosticta paracitricarpa TaxID=2016321 RepID=A0ABR1MXC5_9PEZI